MGTIITSMGIGAPTAIPLHLLLPTWAPSSARTSRKVYFVLVASHSPVGLDCILNKAPPESKSPNQNRSTHTSTSHKGYNQRCVGLSTKFSKTDDILVFQKKVWKHLVNNGMDTIAYLPDPEIANQMISVVNKHARFSVKSARTANTGTSESLRRVRPLQRQCRECLSP